MEEPENVFMYANNLTTGDKLVAIGDALRAGAREQAYYMEGRDFDRDQDFVRISWTEDANGAMPKEHRKKLHDYLCTLNAKVTSMQLDVAVEYIIDQQWD